MKSEPGSWEVRVRSSAEKNLRRAPRHERERLLKALEEMSQDPFAGDIVRLHNQPTAFRRRVGDWRIFFDVDSKQKLLDVLYIERRTTTTYR
jgi:mRNA-degrading endonuclease RelE of RelBE toxin-antitoxin system